MVYEGERILIMENDQEMNMLLSQTAKCKNSGYILWFAIRSIEKVE